MASTMSVSPLAGQVPDDPTVQNAGQFSMRFDELHGRLICSVRVNGSVQVWFPQVLTAPDLVAAEFMASQTALPFSESWAGSNDTVSFIQKPLDDLASVPPGIVIR